jgi:uncharacterized membrane protein
MLRRPMESAPLELETPPSLTRLARAFGLMGLEATSIGLTAWLLFSREVLPGYVHDNTLDPGQRRIVFIDLCVAMAVTAAIVVGIVVWKRRASVGLLEGLALRLSPLSLLWLAPLLFDRRLWNDDDLLVLPFVLAAGWGLVATLRISWSTPPVFPRLASLRGALGNRKRLSERLSVVVTAVREIVTPRVVVTLGAIGYAIYFSAFTIVSHRNLGTHGFDLGLEENLLWHCVHGGLPLFRSTPFDATASHFGNHATWFSYVLAPIYALAPRPETLLVIQAVLMGAAAIPLYLYASRHLPRWTAALVACAYLVYPPLHGANLYDFHYLPLGVVFLWLTLYAVEENRRLLAVVCVVLSLSVREDVAGCLGVLGLFLLLTGAAARAGTIIAVVGGGYFLLMKMVLMPIFGHTDASFLNQYAGLVPKDDPGGFGSVLKTIAANPVFTANIIFSREKVTYLLEVFAPVLLLPLTRPVGLLLVGPGIVFTLLSTGYWPLYQPSFQYTSYWTTFVFIGVVVALEHAGKARHAGDGDGLLRRRTLAIGLFAASLACTYLYGAILHRDDVRSGFGRASFKTTEDDLYVRGRLAELVRQIPPDDKVVASNRLVPHVSTRAYCYTLNQGVQDADWLLFESVFVDNERAIVQETLTDLSFGVVDVQGTLILAKRGAPPDRNMTVLARFVH